MSDIRLSLAALGAALTLIAGIVVPSVRLGIGPMPSSPGARRVIVGLLREKAGPGAGIAEFGAGWGGLAHLIAETFPDHPVLAVEASPLPVVICRLRRFICRRRNLKIRWGRFQTMPGIRPEIVVCYLHPDGMADLALWLTTPAAARVARVIALNFALPDRPWSQRLGQDILRDGPVYLYENVADITKRKHHAPDSP